MLITHQRVGVGFSYADYGETIETTEAASKNIHAFLTIFFETFSQFSGRPLHLAGESYGVSHDQVLLYKNQITLYRAVTCLFLRAKLSIKTK
jgi:hypothetical protein